MGGSEGFEGDHVTRGATSFSQLLFSSDDDDIVGLDFEKQQGFHSSFSTTEKPPKMICFGSYQTDSGIIFSEAATRTPQKSGVTFSEAHSSLASSGNNSTVKTLPKSNKKRNGPGDQETVQCTSTITTTTITTPVANQRTSKKTKTENQNPTSVGHGKVMKVRLGERITALQQLVSPFGKTDTASVLHEAMGYIRFLHDQVQVLSSPYLKNLPEGGENGGEEARKDLRSRGLCLVPVGCTVQVARSNGADFWLPAMGHNVSSSTKQ